MNIIKLNYLYIYESHTTSFLIIVLAISDNGALLCFFQFQKAAIIIPKFPTKIYRKDVGLKII